MNTKLQQRALVTSGVAIWLLGSWMQFKSRGLKIASIHSGYHITFKDAFANNPTPLILGSMLAVIGLTACITSYIIDQKQRPNDTPTMAATIYYLMSIAWGFIAITSNSTFLINQTALSISCLILGVSHTLHFGKAKTA